MEIDANVVNTGLIIGLSVGGALVLCCVVSAVTFFVYALPLADGKPRCRAHPSDFVPPLTECAKRSQCPRCLGLSLLFMRRRHQLSLVMLSCCPKTWTPLPRRDAVRRR